MQRLSSLCSLASLSGAEKTIVSPTGISLARNISVNCTVCVGAPSDCISFTSGVFWTLWLCRVWYVMKSVPSLPFVGTDSKQPLGPNLPQTCAHTRVSNADPWYMRTRKVHVVVFWPQALHSSIAGPAFNLLAPFNAFTCCRGFPLLSGECV